MIHSNFILKHIAYQRRFILFTEKTMHTNRNFEMIHKLSLSGMLNYKFCSGQIKKNNHQNIKSSKKQLQHTNISGEQSKNQGQKQIFTEILQHYEKEELINMQNENKKHTIIARNYNQTQVPGLQTRKYSNISQLQQDIISTNKFDIMNPQILPKTGAANSYVGITQKLTQISLGNVKIKNENQAFLSEVDPYNIPADLDIRFDQKKQLKIVGKETSKQKTIQKTINLEQQQNKSMQIQADTIQQKSINEFMQRQFGTGVKGYQYHFTRKLKRWDIFLTILFTALIVPFIRTFKQLRQNYKTTRQIEQERMKELRSLKKRSFQKVLLENKDFNKIF